jgi:cobalt/nickel transport protein
MARYRRALVAIAVLVCISPLFGVIGAELTGYHEPLDIAAEAVGLREAVVARWSPFTDYTVPGLPDVIGYAVAGAIGVALILALGAALAKVPRRGRGSR